MSRSRESRPRKRPEVRLAARNAVRTADGTTWPLSASDAMEQVQHRLRYGQPTKSDLLTAAGVMSAYAALVALPEDMRRRRVREIREGERLARGDEGGDPRTAEGAGPDGGEA